MSRKRKSGDVVLNYAGVGRLLRSEAIGRAVEAIADDVARIANDRAPGSFHTVRVFQGRDRVRAHVGTDNEAAMRAEVATRNLSRAAASARRRA